jgi:FkbM family methyltransferase
VTLPLVVRVRRLALRLRRPSRSVSAVEGEDARRPAAPDWPAFAERHIGQLLTQLKVDCVLDVGANQGGFAEMIRRAGWGGRIMSFEPQTACRTVLSRRAAHDPAWSIHGAALGDEEGTVRLTLRAASTVTSLHEPRLESAITDEPGFREKFDVVGYEDVPVRRLDTLLDELLDELSGERPERIYLKIDTQGHDEAVIAGSAEIFSRVVALQVELTQDPLYHATSHAATVMEELHRSGFDLNATFPVFRDPHSQAMLEFDGVFVRSARRGPRLTPTELAAIWKPASADGP